MMRYRTYDSQWNRTGYAEAPQYSGQAALTDDYPASCDCGRAMAGCGDGQWLRFRGWSVPAWAKGRSDYIAWCAKGHEMKRVAIV